jgi:hypothetical protein
MSAEDATDATPCYVCYEPFTETAPQMDPPPCDCKGSCGGIHIECLRTFIRNGFDACRTCRKPYDYSKFLTDRDKLISFIKSVPDAIQFVEQDEELCKIAIANSGLFTFNKVLEMVKPAFKTHDFYRHIIEQIGDSAIKYLPQTKEMLRMAFDVDPRNARCIPHAFIDDDMIAWCVAEAPKLIMHIVPRHKQTPEIIARYTEAMLPVLNNLHEKKHQTVEEAEQECYDKVVSGRRSIEDMRPADALLTKRVCLAAIETKSTYCRSGIISYIVKRLGYKKAEDWGLIEAAMEETPFEAFLEMPAEKYTPQLLDRLIEKGEGCVIFLVPHHMQTKPLVLRAATAMLRENPRINSIMRMSLFGKKGHTGIVKYVGEDLTVDMAAFLRPDLLADEEIIHAALKIPEYNMIAHIEQTADRVDVALEADPNALNLIKQPTLIQCREVMRRSSSMYEFVPKAFRDDPEIVQHAITNSSFLRLYPKSLTPELCLEAVRKCASSRGFMALHESILPWKPVLFTPEVCREGIQRCYLNFYHIPEKRQTHEMAVLALTLSMKARNTISIHGIRKDLREGVVKEVLKSYTPCPPTEPTLPVLLVRLG